LVFPPLNYGEDTIFIDWIIKDGYIIKRNLSKPKYLVVRHKENTDSNNISYEILQEENKAKYFARKYILEEIKHKIEADKSLRIQ